MTSRYRYPDDLEISLRSPRPPDGTHWRLEIHGSDQVEDLVDLRLALDARSPDSCYRVALEELAQILADAEDRTIRCSTDPRIPNWIGPPPRSRRAGTEGAAANAGALGEIHVEELDVEHVEPAPPPATPSPSALPAREQSAPELAPLERVAYSIARLDPNDLDVARTAANVYEALDAMHRQVVRWRDSRDDHGRLDVAPWALNTVLDGLRQCSLRVQEIQEADVARQAASSEGEEASPLHPPHPPIRLPMPDRGQPLEARVRAVRERLESRDDPEELAEARIALEEAEHAIAWCHDARERFKLAALERNRQHGLAANHAERLAEIAQHIADHRSLEGLNLTDARLAIARAGLWISATKTAEQAMGEASP